MKITVSVLVLFLFGYVGWSVISNNAATDTIVTTENGGPEQTVADKQQYNNEVFGYRFLYPKEWILDQRSDVVAIFSNLNEKWVFRISMTDKGMLEREIGVYKFDDNIINVGVGELRTGHTLTFDMDTFENKFSNEVGSQVAIFQHPDSKYVIQFVAAYHNEQEQLAYADFDSSLVAFKKVIETLEINEELFLEGSERQDKIQEAFMNSLE
jgi:hypothetical protein